MYKDLYLKTKVTCVFFLSILDPNERKLNIVSTFVLEIKVTVIYKIVVFFYSYTWSFLTIVSTCTTCTSRELRLVCKIYPFKFLSRHFTLVKLCIYQSLQFYAPHPKKRGGAYCFASFWSVCCDQVFLLNIIWPLCSIVTKLAQSLLLERRWFLLILRSCSQRSRSLYWSLTQIVSTQYIVTFLLDTSIY